MQILTADIDELASAAITERIDGPAGPFYRRVFHLRFQTSGSPDRLEVQTEQCAFHASFSSRSYNVLAGGSPVGAVARQVDEYTVRLELPRPWPIERIRLRSTFGPGIPLLPEAQPQGGYIWACAAAPDLVLDIDATAMEFEGPVAQMQPTVWIQLFRMDGDALAEKPSVTVPENGLIGADFTSAVFAIKAVNSDLEPYALSVADLSAVEIRSWPTGPRIGLCVPAQAPGDLRPEACFWQLPGQITDEDSCAAPNEQAGSALAGALQHHFKARLEQLAVEAKENKVPYAVPDCLEVALVVDSDAPCQSQITLAVAYCLVRTGLMAPEEEKTIRDKQVLRFAAQAPPPQTLWVLLPARAQVCGAVLEMDAGFGSPPSAAVGEGLQPLPADAHSAVHLTTARWCAQPVMLDAPLELTEITLGVMALESGTELTVALRADRDGLPDGALIAEQSVRLSGPGTKYHARVAFRAAIALSSQCCWLTVKALSGSAVWLTRANPQGTLCLAQTSHDGGISVNLKRLSGIEAFYSLFCRNTRPASQSNAAVTLEAGGQPVALSPQDSGRWQADDLQLTAALNACMAAPAGPDCRETAEGRAIALKFSASTKGILTVYPPTLNYDVLAE